VKGLRGGGGTGSPKRYRKERGGGQKKKDEMPRARSRMRLLKGRQTTNLAVEKQKGEHEEGERCFPRRNGEGVQS